MLSRQHETIFVHAPRCAGESVEALFLGEPDVGYMGDPFAGSPEKHWGVREYQQAYPEEFRTHFKFSIVRNPWDRMVSWVKYRDRRFNRNRGTFEERFIGDLRDPVFTDLARSKSYTAMLTIQGELLVDEICYFDRLEEQLPALNERTGVDFLKLPRTNGTQHDHYRKYYTAQSARLVGALFESDVELFGFEF